MIRFRQETTRRRRLWAALILIPAIPAIAAVWTVQENAQPLRAVVMTGGHSFDEAEFPKLFEGHEGIEFTIAPQADHSELFEDISDWSYDVIVIYAMTDHISPKRRLNFLSLLERGVGVVGLHHVVTGFPNWPEYRKIIGAKYLREVTTIDGAPHGPSSYKHDIDFNVRIADPDHPITRGLADFQVFDETYKNCFFEPDNRPLLTTDHPTSDPVIGWTRTWRNARICTLQPGHGPTVFTQPGYRELVARAVRWTAGSLE